MLPAGRRWGKALSLDTEVLTTNGIKSVGEVKVGDIAYGTDGEQTEVIYVSPIYENRKCYELEFSDGEKIVADAEHDWVVETKQYRKALGRAKNPRSSLKTITTEEISNTYLFPRKDGKIERNYSIQTCMPLKNKRKVLPVDPYYLGVWLGDGHSDGSRITNTDKEVISFLNSYAESIGHKVTVSKDGITYSITSKGKKKNNLQGKLRKLGVLKNKHIPVEYLTASVTDRKKLLNGLIDSDGHVEKGGYCEYTSISERLAKDVFTLINTLGFKATINSYDCKFKGKYLCKKYRIHFTTDRKLGKIERKSSYSKKKSETIKRRYIVNVKRVKSVPVKCIGVNSKDHLFLVGRSLIATHNTTLSLFEILVNALQTPGGLVWYVAPTYKQAKNIAWITLKRILPKEIIKKVNESELSIILYNGCRIELKGCDNEDTLLGVGVNFLVFDEIGVVRNAKIIWQEILRPMLVDTKGRALFIGTPRGQNYFYEIYELGQNKDSEYESFRFKTSDNPYIDKKEIDKARSETHPTYFAQEYEASFVTDEERTLITSRDLEGLKNNYPSYNEIREVIVCDPSQGGDECVIYAMRDYDIIDEEVLHERDTMKIAGHISVMAGKHDIRDISGDSIGLGAGIFDRLDEMKQYRVHRIHSAETAIEKHRFRNVRAEMWWLAMELIRDRKVPNIRTTKLRKQLTSVKFDVTDSQGRIRLEPKEKTKTIIGESPDRADTYVMGVYALKCLVDAVEKDPYRLARHEDFEYDYNPNTV